MRRSAKRHDVEGWSASAGAAALLGLIARNPTLVGSTTAFLVALSFVSANALWYQPHAHSGAFFATRSFPEAARFAPDETGTTIIIERPGEEPSKPAGDPKVELVQGILKDLKFYNGEVDGLAGPNTRKAIEAYQSRMGMTVSGLIDAQLLDQLGAGSQTAAIRPSPAPRDAAAPARRDAIADAMDETPALPAGRTPDERIVRIQAGLKAFGNEAIEIDGVMGSRTKTAILEFQSLFGLTETGEADEAVYAKMREIGLTN